MKFGDLIRCVLMGLAMMILTTGCGGLNASGSVSPASFFLPGLLKKQTPRPPLISTTNTPALAQF
ncbi:MAG: hypothetical protein EXS36_05225 [Pedosphaera sp.]|nr:hypothetical protein [Pedosphaera sp.]